MVLLHQCAEVGTGPCGVGPRYGAGVLRCAALWVMRGEWVSARCSGWCREIRFIVWRRERVACMSPWILESLRQRMSVPERAHHQGGVVCEARHRLLS